MERIAQHKGVAVVTRNRTPRTSPLKCYARYQNSTPIWAARENATTYPLTSHFICLRLSFSKRFYFQLLNKFCVKVLSIKPSWQPTGTVYAKVGKGPQAFHKHGPGTLFWDCQSPRSFVGSSLILLYHREHRPTVAKLRLAPQPPFPASPSTHVPAHMSMYGQIPSFVDLKKKKIRFHRCPKMFAHQVRPF